MFGGENLLLPIWLCAAHEHMCICLCLIGVAGCLASPCIGWIDTYLETKAFGSRRVMSLSTKRGLHIKAKSAGWSNNNLGNYCRSNRSDWSVRIHILKPNLLFTRFVFRRFSCSICGKANGEGRRRNESAWEIIKLTRPTRFYFQPFSAPFPLALRKQFQCLCCSALPSTGFPSSHLRIPLFIFC